MKPKLDRRSIADLALAQAAIRACLATYSNPFFADIAIAVEREEIRLVSALTDHRLLWSLYRRRDKGIPYYQLAPVESERIAA